MRVLYLSYDGLTDPLGQSQILPYLKGLAKLGYDIDIITFEKAAFYQKFGQQVSQQCVSAKIGYFPQRYYKNPPVLSTLINIYQMRQKAIQLHKENQYRVVHCRSYIASLVGLHLKKHHGVKFIFDMRGFYADERVDGHIWPQHKWLYRKIYRFFKRKERAFLAAADHIVSLTHNAQQEILSWDILPDKARISVIPCCVDTQLFDRSRISDEQILKLKKSIDLAPEASVVGYVGSTGTWYLLDDMLRYFGEVRKNDPSAIMLFLTYDPPSQIWRSAAKAGVPKAAIRIKACARNEVPQWMALFNWSVFFIKPVYSKKASSPTKQGELMSMGIPVVCNAKVGDTERIVHEYNAGICIENTGEGELIKAANQSVQLRNLDRSAIVSGAKQYFSLENGIAQLGKIYSLLKP